jgi:NADH dehydrogenase
MNLVAGATGSLGGQIVRELLARGQPVRALIRDPAQCAALDEAGAETTVGDLTDPSTLDAACRGVDVVVSTASATRREDDTVENVDLQGTRNLVDAARSAGVRRFVYVSTNGASLGSPVPAFRAKAGAEAHIRASGLEYAVLQPEAFMDIWFGMLIEMPMAQGMPITLVGESRQRHSFIAQRDVAQFAVAAALSPEPLREAIVLGGPEAVTFREVAEAYAEAAGRPLAIRSVAPGEPIPGLPPVVWGIAAGLESYGSDVPMEATARRFGIRLTSYKDFIRGRVTALAGSTAAPSP